MDISTSNPSTINTDLSISPSPDEVIPLEFILTIYSITLLSGLYIPFGIYLVKLSIRKCNRYETEEHWINILEVISLTFLLIYSLILFLWGSICSIKKTCQIWRPTAATATRGLTTTRGLTGTNIVALAAFLYRRPQNSGIEECAICLSSLDGRIVRMLSDCIHIFHVECIDKWLCLHSTCPLCRRKVRLL